MKLIFFGLSITSSWGNGHATTYRGLLKALAAAGHDLTFIEKRTDYYAANTDAPPAAIPYARVILYEDWVQEGQPQAATAALGADAVVLGSYCADGVQIANWLAASYDGPSFYYDIDTPVTLKAWRAGQEVAYIQRRQLTQFAAVLSFTGGQALADLRHFGAREAVPLYCAVDPDLHRPVPIRDDLQAELGYMGTYSVDRVAAVDYLFFQPARTLVERRFIIAGPQYPDVDRWPANVLHIPHLYPADHSAFYCSTRLTVNATRQAMVYYGYCPSVRLFEAAGCAAPVLSDVWQGLDELFTPDKEILLAENAADVRAHLQRPTAELRAIGQAAYQRVLREHTYAVRAHQLEGYIAAAR